MKLTLYTYYITTSTSSSPLGQFCLVDGSYITYRPWFQFKSTEMSNPFNLNYHHNKYSKIIWIQMPTSFRYNSDTHKKNLTSDWAIWTKMVMHKYKGYWACCISFNFILFWMSRENPYRIVERIYQYSPQICLFLTIQNNVQYSNLKISNYIASWVVASLLCTDNAK